MTDGSGPSTFSACVVADDGRLLLLRRAFSHRVDPGAWTTSLRGSPAAGEPPEDAARRQALRLLGLRLDDVRPVLPDGQLLVARVRRRVVVPDPTQFDEAEWVEWDGLVSSVRAGTLPVTAWSAHQVERLAALGPAAGWPGPALLGGATG